MRSQDETKEKKKEKEVEEKEEEEKEKEDKANIKSNNPHLTGGEKENEIVPPFEDRWFEPGFAASCFLFWN